MNRIKNLYKVFCDNPIVTTDSRNIPGGAIFFAIHGDNFNGNDFAKDALNNGAAYAVVDNSVQWENEKFIVVENTLSALQQLAMYHRKALGTKILAITGTNGKTTTKELCKIVLGKKYNVLATFGNLNNHIGVPLTLLTLTKETNIGIIEMGANHPGEINELCKIALPDYGLITNIGMAHLEGFVNIDGVAKTKGELFTYLRQNNKTLFVNKMNKYIKSITPEDYDKCISYNDEFCKGDLLSCNPFLKIKINSPDYNFIVNSNLVGKYNIENIVASVVTGNYFDVPVNLIKEAIEEYTPDNLRSQFIDTGLNKIIMDAYNANPTSMISAIENFLGMDGDNKMMILGQMLELGDVSANEHNKIIEFLDSKQFMNVFYVGDSFLNAAVIPDSRYFSSIDDLISRFHKSEIKSQLILIKGSRGNKLEKLLPIL